MRSIGNVDVDVVRAEYSRQPRERVDVLGQVERNLHKLILGIRETILSHQRLIAARNSVKIIEGSSLTTPIRPSSVDYIVTSPPYGVESLSYLRTHLLSYRCLNTVLKHDPYEVSDQFIGSEYSGNGKGAAPDWEAGEVSRTFKRFFQNVWPTEKGLLARTAMMMRFFSQMVRMADCFHRWVRPGGRIAFVIGNKRIGEHIIPTDVIIREIFESRGLLFDQALKHKLKCNNSNSEVPWQERIIQDEYVLFFSKTR
jgi:methylase of polypeptide subunit release factors